MRQYGPPNLSLTILRDPRFPEDSRGTITRHVRTTNDRSQLRLYPNYEALEVMWSARDGVKTMQTEELVRRDATSYFTRYAHARWDTRSEHFIHFDGAVRVYDKAGYSERQSRGLRGGRDLTSNYVKLFRIDCPLGIGEWTELLVGFFRGNELMAEYLSTLDEGGGSE